MCQSCYDAHEQEIKRLKNILKYTEYRLKEEEEAYKRLREIYSVSR
jgi:hypothetical protein